MKNVAGSGRRRTATKSMTWMKRRVRPLAPLPHRLDEAPEPGDEAVAADAQERAARHVPDAGCLHDQHAGLALGEAAVPLEHLGGDVAVLGRPPRHHRRHPRAVGRQAVSAETDRREPAGLLGLLARRPARRRERVSDADPGRRRDSHLASLPRRRAGRPPAAVPGCRGRRRAARASVGWGPAAPDGARPRTARRGPPGAAASAGRGGGCCRGPPRACSDSSGRAAGRGGAGATPGWDPRAGARSADCSRR